MEERPGRRGFGTSRRLAVGFGALVLLIGAASAVALAGSARVHEGLAETRRREGFRPKRKDVRSSWLRRYAHLVTNSAKGAVMRTDI